MTRDTYPPPGFNPRLRLASVNETPEFGATREQWEERIFRIADHFNVVRHNPGGGSDIATVKTFTEALFLAHNKERHLVYVVTLNGDAFCMPPKDYAKFADMTLKMRGEAP